MLFYVRDPQRRAIARESFFEDCQRIRQGLTSKRALETDIYVTNVCNLRCDYCYFYFEDYFNAPSHHFSKDPALQKLQAMIDKVSGKTYCLVILGGEPFARRDLTELLLYIRTKDIFSIRISTNGLLLKKRKEALPLIDTLSVSFDAMRMRQYPEHEQRLLRDLSDLKTELGNDLPKIVLSWTTSTDDKFDCDVRPVLDYAKEHSFIVKFLPLKVNQQADWGIERSMILQALDYIGPEYITNQLGHTLQLETGYGKKNCLIQGNQFYIDYEGQFLYPCDEYAHQKVGSVYDHELDVLYEEGVRRFGEYPKSNGVCAHCPSGCHSDNSYILRNPERQLQWLE